MIEDFIEVKLPDESSFLKVKETLTRIGAKGWEDGQKVLWQSCHILHKRGKYYIVHFKELFKLDEKIREERGFESKGRETDFTDEDKARRNTIANLLAEWKLVVLTEPDKSKEPVAPLHTLKILPYREKDQWSLQTKYSIGKSKV